MCYRDNVPPLDLRGIHLACLAGDNGHGKSALLDAMTWVLWGKARVSRDDQLIHLEQTEMEVELEFQLGPHRYRVIRKRDSRRGQSVLELQGWADGRYLPLTEPTIRQTQAAIIDLLHMDYETFINSAFLVQGRADEFTTKPPGERKRILGEILGLSIYDEYAERAKVRAKAKAQATAELTAQIQEIDRELERLPQYETQLQEAETTAAELGEQLRNAEGEQKQLQMAQQALLHQQQQLEELKGRLAQGERELAEIAEQLRAAQAQVAGCEQTLAQQEEIEAKYAELLAAQEAVENWNGKLAAQRPLMEERRQLDKAIGEAKGKLSEELGRVKAQVSNLRARVQAGEAQKAPLAKAQAMLAELEKQQEKRETLREELAALAEEAATLKTQNEQLQAEMDDLKEKIELLRKTEEAACPLCQQPLDKVHREQLLADFQAEGKAKGDQWRSNKERLEIRAAQEAELRKEDGLLARALRALPAQQRRLAEAQTKADDGKAAMEELSNVEAKLAALQARLKTHDFAPAGQEHLAAVLTRLEEVGYDETAHEKARAQAAALSDWETRKRELDLASEQVKAEREQVAVFQKRQTRWQETLADDEAKWEKLAAAVSRLPEVSSKLVVATRQVEEIEGQERQARLRLGAARQRVDTCHRLAKERKVKQATQREAAEVQAIYEELREAFGRRGLQAMIIEAALPEIEAEANRLLSRMSDGPMTVRLDTQRELKKGTVQETLDIIIADELGPRNYNLFSGGEAFRINFALRIAISKLLARRAGAQLRTLFIDEGFGTQDTQGRQRLVEAINTIKEDFDRILVITHIEELKDMFPVRIDVVKTAQGSLVSLH
jgi:exonuclease SbcC